MGAVKPRHVVCILGHWQSLGPVEAIVRPFCGAGFELDNEYSQLARDPRMVSAFEASYDRVSPTMTEQDWRAVSEHSAIAYVLSPPIPKKSAMEISGMTLLLTAALLQSGGVAAKGESAGIAHGRARWLELASDFARAAKRDDLHAQGSALYRTWVRRPLLSDDDGVYYSCGMHLLGERDIEVKASIEVNAAVAWIDLLGLYLVADRPYRPLRDGDGFRRPRRIMRLLPCERYEDDEFMFNPYGYIRLLRASPER